MANKSVIDFQITTEIKDAIRNNEKLRKDYVKLQNEVDKLKEKGKKSSDENKKGIESMTASMGKSVLGAMGLASAFGTVVSTIKEAIQATKELQKLSYNETVNRAGTYDKLLSQFVIGRGSNQDADLKKIINSQANRYGYSTSSIETIIGEAGNNGFSLDNIKNFLPMFLSSRQAAFDKSPEETSASFFRYLKTRYGGDVSKLTSGQFGKEANLFMTAQEKLGLNKESLEQFSELAAKQTNMSSEEIFNALASSINATGKKDASEGISLQNKFMDTVTKIKDNKDLVAYLGQKGIDFKGFDLTGENQTQALSNLGGSLSKYDQEKQLEILRKIFGAEEDARLINRLIAESTSGNNLVKPYSDDELKTKIEAYNQSYFAKNQRSKNLGAQALDGGKNIDNELIMNLGEATIQKAYNSGKISSADYFTMKKALSARGLLYSNSFDAVKETLYDDSLASDGPSSNDFLGLLNTLNFSSDKYTTQRDFDSTQAQLFREFNKNLDLARTGNTDVLKELRELNSNMRKLANTTEKKTNSEIGNKPLKEER